MEHDSDRPGFHTLWSGPDPHGQAALVLMESLLHGLIEKSVLTTQEALAVVERAAEVKTEIAPDLGDTPDALEKSLALLDAIATSLAHDLTGGRHSDSPNVAG